MRLAELINGLTVRAVHGPLPGDEITGLCHDSRRAAPGCLFAALPGLAVDGRRFVGAAARAGAVAALVQRPVPDAGLCQVEVADARLALALISQRFFGWPGRELDMVAITGTNGKTTVSYLCEALLAPEGPTGVIGTVEARWPGVHRPAAMTTPESLELAALLAEMRGAGVGRVVMEVSSHALAQRRVDGIAFDAALFTNLSRDHLDYHSDMEDYFAAKSRLFNELLPASRQAGKSPVAVICADNPWGVRLAEAARQAGLSLLTYGFEAAADVRGLDPRPSLAGGSLRVSHAGGEFAASTGLVGRYNLQNLLAACALGLARGMDPERIAVRLASLAGVPGRLQRVGGGSPAVFVDYAHTDDALAQVLAALKPLTAGRLICVFGAGGDRDTGKRPLMGLAVGRGADLAVLTSDNPRTEEPGAIMDMVEPGLLKAGMHPAADLATAPAGRYLREADRAAAIALAVSAAAPQDVVLIAGKGHENYQIVGREKRHFDDREQAAAALGARADVEGCRAQA